MEIYKRKIVKTINYNTFRVSTPIWGSREIKIINSKSSKIGMCGMMENKEKIKNFEGKMVEIVPVKKFYNLTIAEVFYKEEFLTHFSF